MSLDLGFVAYVIVLIVEFAVALRGPAGPAADLQQKLAAVPNLPAPGVSAADFAVILDMG